MERSRPRTATPPEVIRTWRALAPEGSSMARKLVSLGAAARHHQALRSVQTAIPPLRRTIRLP